MSYENAPATKLLATNCACCGRALVDAVSVETGVGPDCREMHGFDEAQGEPDWTRAMALLDGFVAVAEVNPSMTPRDAVNVLVHRVARCGASIDKEVAAFIFRAIDALGFQTLAARIAKRFRSTVEEPVVEEPAGPTVEELRAAYASVRREFCYDNCAPRDFDAAVREMVGADAKPADFVAAAHDVSCPCQRCNGTGEYLFTTRDGEERSGACFRCGGKGEQDLGDVRRNRGYDAWQRRRVANAKPIAMVG